jgi:hypothetical protein
MLGGYPRAAVRYGLRLLDGITDKVKLGEVGLLQASII